MKFSIPSTPSTQAFTTPATRHLSLLDYRPGLRQVARLSEIFRCDPIALITMTLFDAPADSAE
jgi:hypothetical protein